MGLNEWASDFIRGEEVLAYTEEVTRVYPNGQRKQLEPRPVHEPSAKKEESGKFYTGMFGDEYPLHKYTLPNGQVYFEKVQSDTWSSGPVFFLALQDKNGVWVEESLWPEEDIMAA